jgi:hypothetical protein
LRLAQCIEPGAEVLSSHGILDCSHDFCLANTGGSKRTACPRGGAIEEPFSEGDGCVAASGRRCIGVHGIPEGALAANLFNESTGAVEQRNPPAHGRSWDLPKPGFCDPTCGNYSARAGRGMEHWTSLLQLGVDGQGYR